VISYTFESIIIYMPESAFLCSATSATEIDFDMTYSGLCLKDKNPSDEER